jgi:hypothetical protein
VFSDILSRSQQGQIPREELDQRLLNWVLEVPGMKEKADELSPEMRGLVDKFSAHDLKDPFVVDHGVTYPAHPATAKKTAHLKAALEAQFKIDGCEKFPSIVENTGKRVEYVERTAFENWGETIKNTPSVSSLFRICLNGR